MRKKMLVIDIMTKEAIKEVLEIFVGHLNSTVKMDIWGTTQLVNIGNDLLSPLMSPVEELRCCPLLNILYMSGRKIEVCASDKKECTSGQNIQWFFKNECRQRFFEKS